MTAGIDNTIALLQAGPPVLTTPRLQLSRLSMDHAPEILILRSDPRVIRYIRREPPRTLEDAKAFVRKAEDGLGKLLVWAITQKEVPGLAGTICLWNFSEDKTTAELGYELLPAYHGHGIMNEALKAVLFFGFDSLRLDMIEAFTHRNNEPSLRLLHRNGFMLTTRTDEDNEDNAVLELQRKDHKP